MNEMEIHLLVLVHGMWGNPGHLAEVKRIILETKGVGGSGRKDTGMELEVLVAHSNKDESTYDGIDWGGERIANEIVQKVKELREEGKTTVRFSIFGYSLGGLLARYVIGILRTRSFFDNIEPINFTTIATPHIGLVRIGSLWSKLGFSLGPTLLSRTGEQFYGIDTWGTTGRSLVDIMADPKEVFYQSLLEFAHIRIYGNAVNDTTVPYPSALLDTRDPFVDRAKTGIDVVFDPKYEPIMLSYSIPEEPPAKERRPTLFSPTWFRNFQINHYLPPFPFLNRLNFPLNAVALATLPILIPAFFFLAIVRLSSSSWSSRKRIKLLERDEHFQENALVHAFAKFESEMERVVIDAIEDSQGNDSEVRPSLGTNGHVSHADMKMKGNGVAQVSPTVKVESHSKSNPADKRKPPSSQPKLSPAQHSMVEHLNAIPQLKKFMAYIDPMRNSHATIIARDVKNFEYHKRGWGVLRHWADGFVL